MSDQEELETPTREVQEHSP